MALVLDSTVGGASANSYISRADATTYFEAAYNDRGWSALSNENKDRALVAATRAVDRLEFRERPATTTQRLKWPRLYVRKLDTADSTAYYSATELPQQIKDAVCELAVALAAGTQSETDKRRIKSIESDDQSITYESDGRTANALPDAVMQLLAPFLRGARLVRA